MSKELRVKVNGKSYVVEISDFSGGLADVTVNGTQYSIEIEDAGGAVLQPVVKTTSAAIPGPVKAAPITATPVAIASASNGDVISAPMPGVILDIAVKPGDKLAAGATVCALEAMKMKNILRTPREGTVASVEVSEGQRVPFGAVIIRFA
ncbi:MAG: acetyl-CoA carboxylase biotin carboxyl carrier protein subunit [Anaerolinea sp.]|nr:acetyl-CoA carboxylase biotin carboxyl carrier protein subunit [Anaerolinea sp.]